MLRPRRAWRDLHTTSVVTGAFESFAYRCLPRPYWAASLKNGEAGVIQTINRRRGKPPKDGRSQDGTGARPNPSAQTALLTNAKGGRPPPLRIRGEAGAVPAWNRKKPTRRMAIGKAGEKAHRAIHAA